VAIGEPVLLVSSR